MNQEVNIDNNTKKLKLYYGLLVTVLCIIGVSFAWFRLYLSQNENNTIASRTCFNTTLTEDTSKISLTDAFPITDEDGLKQTPFTFTIKNNCNSYVKVYITIDSTYRESTSTSYLKDNYMKVNISPKGTTTSKSVILGSQTLTDLENNKKGYIIVSTGLKANEEKSYDLRIWMDSAVTTEQGLNKNWSGKIVVVSNASNEPTFAETILANNEVKTPITTLGKEASAHTKDDVVSEKIGVSTSYQKYYITYGTGWEANGTKFNLTGATVTSDTYANSYSSLVGKYLPSADHGSSTAGTMIATTNLSSVYYVVSATKDGYIYKEITSNKNTTESLLASAEDDYGTSYYFRGAVKNNYVEFANKCWRIVRIVGDGSVKLILHNDNTTGVANPCSSANNSANAAFARYSGTEYTSVFNINSDDNAYVGFKYGDFIGCNGHPEITDKLDCSLHGYKWIGSSSYAEAHANINKSTILNNLETWYNNNLKTYADAIADNVWCNDKTNAADTTYDPWSITPNGLGYGTNKTYYGVTQRLVSANGSDGGTGPSLKCNGELSKINSKVGLITADELAYAGHTFNIHNTTTYLRENATNTSWWSLSPSYFSGSETYVWRMDNYFGYIDRYYVRDYSGVRPSISLVSSTTISGGLGTSEDPYVINQK